ncbi:MAG TPA: YeeE/YedE family protein [Acidiferrobacterales bacterium]|nr:YeeE/YedE family protein [Acidiferrobacterales bacterium]
MEFTIHHQVLGLVFLAAMILGAVANKTDFCTMGAVSDWVNMGATGRMRAWLFAMTVALLGVMVLEGAGKLVLPADTFPPYRTGNFAWLRYVLGGVMFGVGMTLGSGCGNKTLVRIGGGNLKSVMVLVIASIAAYYMLWGDIGGVGFYDKFFNSWIAPSTIDLPAHGMASQELGAIVTGLTGAANLHYIVGGILVAVMLAFIFKSADFRASFDNIFGGLVVGLVVIAGWYLTGGPMGAEWKDYAELATDIPSRVNVQSFTFISPMGDSARYLLNPSNLMLINFGVMALTGVIVGSFLYAVLFRKFRIEWFASGKDFVNHAVGGVLMGIGGVLSMGCTIGQAVTGVSTLALGSILTFVAIVFGSALTMKVQYYQMDEQGFFSALRSALADLRLLPRKA